MIAPRTVFGCYGIHQKILGTNRMDGHKVKPVFSTTAAGAFPAQSLSESSGNPAWEISQAKSEPGRLTTFHPAILRRIALMSGFRRKPVPFAFRNCLFDTSRVIN